MKFLLPLAALAFSCLLSSCATSYAGASSDDEARKRAVIATEQQRVDALVHDDFAALGRIFADDMTYSHSSGEIDTKTSYLKKLTTGALKYKSLEHSGLTVRLYGDTAILTGMTKVYSVAAGVDNKPVLNFLTVYVWREGAWRLEAWHSTKMPDPVPPAT